MKPEVNWTEDYINNVLPSIDEQDWIECKRGDILNFKEDKDAKLTKLAKEISALANSGGGFLAFGIDDKTMEIYDGGVDISIAHNTKEWLENVIPGLTDPPLRNFNVLTIRGNKPDSKLHEGKAIFVIDIGDSEQAPHQSTKDNKYYIRSASHAIPANHQIVMDIIGRRKYPKLEVSFNYAFHNIAEPNVLLSQGDKPILVTRLKNIGSVYAEYVNVILLISPFLLDPNGQEFYGRNSRIYSESYVRIIRENIINELWSPAGIFMGREAGRITPILPGREHSFAIPLNPGFHEQKEQFSNTDPLIKYELFADNAPVIRGETPLKLIQINSSLPGR